MGHLYSADIHAIEFDDELRTLYEMGIIPTTTASPSITIDVSLSTGFITYQDTDS